MSGPAVQAERTLRPATIRLPDWQVRLAALVEDRLSAGFAWGVRDCCLWAADAVMAVTGVDLAADMRGTYATLDEAAAMFVRVRGLEVMCDRRLGQAIVPDLAQPGDVGYLVEAGQPALAVHVGGAWMAQGATGLVPVQPEAIRKAWRCCGA